MVDEKSSKEKSSSMTPEEEWEVSQSPHHHPTVKKESEEKLDVEKERSNFSKWALAKGHSLTLPSLNFILQRLSELEKNITVLKGFVVNEISEVNSTSEKLDKIIEKE